LLPFLEKPRKLFAKLNEKDKKDRGNSQKRAHRIKTLKRDKKILLQIVKHLEDKDSKLLLSQEAYKEK
jgi:hypothetical protein